jgi:hypothetical protein
VVNGQCVGHYVPALENKTIVIVNKLVQ